MNRLKQRWNDIKSNWKMGLFMIMPIIMIIMIMMIMMNAVETPRSSKFSGCDIWSHGSARGNGAMADIIGRSFDPPKAWVDMGKPSETCPWRFMVHHE